MFGSSGTPGKEDEPVIDSGSHSDAPKPSKIAIPNDINNGGEKRAGHSPERKSPEDAAALEKKRRSSGVSKARDIFSSAKQSLHLHGSSPTSAGSADKGSQSPLAKFGKTDPALSVPQGALNNSAGESAPTPRSTFRVGVTEDKNKKCRRTMEDTHAYLYNFLSTPAPAIGADTASKGDSASNILDNSTQNVVETDNGYFAIFDGHAGTFAADWCGKKLHLLLEENIRKNPNKPIPELLDQTFTSVDQQLEKLPLKNSGCTAVIAVLRWEDRIPTSQSATGSAAIAPAAAAVVKAASESHSGQLTGSEAQMLSQVSANATDAAPALADGRPESVAEALPKLREAAERQRVLYTANVGDARIVLCRNGRALRLSYDHKGSDEMEGKRVAHAGGLILNNRVNGVLAVTRALGDAYMKDLVTGHPYTTETIIQPDQDEFLILACDGLWDVCSDQEAIDLIRHTHDPQVASKQLVDYALARFSTDNLSIMVVRFDNKAFKERLHESSVGVDKDRASSKGGISETDAILSQAKRHIGDMGGVSDKSIAKIIQEEEEAEPGPELNANAARAAMKNPPN